MLLAAPSLFAQSGPAPRGISKITVSGKSITVNYGRPELKGRSMDALLSKLPPDRIWRAGENQVTTLTTTGPIVIGNKRVAAGTYSLYVHIPKEGDWALVLNTDPGIELVKIYAKAPPNVAHELWPRLDGYTKNISDKEVARIPMQKGSGSAPAELFTIDLKPVSQGALLEMSWGDVRYSVDVKSAE
jgi:hypothetical protein